MKLTLRGDLADLDIEIILQPSVVRQADGAAAEQAPAEGQPTNTAAGSSAAIPLQVPAAVQPDGSNAGGRHVDHQDDSPVEISAAIVGGVTNDCESPAAGDKAVSPIGGDHALTDEAEVARVVPPPDIPAAMASIGDQVRAAVANPPPPVEAPVELDLRRPPVEDDALEIPAFLRRAS